MREIVGFFGGCIFVIYTYIFVNYHEYWYGLAAFIPAAGIATIFLIHLINYALTTGRRDG